MRFNLFANDELIGYSEFEDADPSMGVRSGKFVRHHNYSKYQNLFREHSRSRTEIQVDVQPADEYEKLRKQLESLRLRIETDNGEAVGTMAIDLEDFSEELGEDGDVLSMVVVERSTYEKFLGNGVRLGSQLKQSYEEVARWLLHGKQMLMLH
jgi:hypothetical protein